MKPLPPSIREKERYLRFRIHAEEKVEFGELADAVWSAVLGYIGSKGAGNSNHWIISNQFNEDKQEGIIRVERSSVDDFRAALSFINSFGDKNGFLEITKVSGSIKKVEDN